MAFTGGFLGLLITGKDLSAIAMIGFVMLAGIIVNNGIVLVDTINQLRESGYEFEEANPDSRYDACTPDLDDSPYNDPWIIYNGDWFRARCRDDAADGDRYDRWFDLWNFTNIISGSMYLWTLQ